MNIDEAKTHLKYLLLRMPAKRSADVWVDCIHTEAIRTCLAAYDIVEASYQNAHACEDSLCKEVERLEKENTELRNNYTMTTTATPEQWAAAAKKLRGEE